MSCNFVSSRTTELRGYNPRNIKILMDDIWHAPPTRNNIVSLEQQNSILISVIFLSALCYQLAAFRWLAKGVNPGDSLFFAYSGHGAQVVDESGDEADGMDEGESSSFECLDMSTRTSLLTMFLAMVPIDWDGSDETLIIDDVSQFICYNLVLMPK